MKISKRKAKKLLLYLKLAETSDEANCLLERAGIFSTIDKIKFIISNFDISIISTRSTKEHSQEEQLQEDLKILLYGLVINNGGRYRDKDVFKSEKEYHKEFCEFLYSDIGQAIIEREKGHKSLDKR